MTLLTPRISTNALNKTLHQSHPGEEKPKSTAAGPLHHRDHKGTVGVYTAQNARIRCRKVEVFYGD